MLFIWKKVDAKKEKKKKGSNIGSCPQVPVFQTEEYLIFQKPLLTLNDIKKTYLFTFYLSRHNDLVICVFALNSFCWTNTRAGRK